MTPETVAATAAIILPALLTLRYIYLCYAHPFREHRRCNGTGRIPYLIGRGWRFCPRCNGTGLRLRTGRRLWNHARRLHRDGTPMTIVHDQGGRHPKVEQVAKPPQRRRKGVMPDE